jgi:acetyl-CoA acyltransferase
LKTVFRKEPRSGRNGHSRECIPTVRRRLRGLDRQRKCRRAARASNPSPASRGRGAHGNDPQYFGYAPVEAANKALAKAGIGWDQVGAVELNEAFAAQSLACINAWGIDPSIMNAHGGAIAMGHPLGASGTRILGTLARSLQASGQRWGVAAICIGVGQGLAVVLENVTAGVKG